MTKLTEAQITALKEAEQKATPGPWIGGTIAGWSLPSQVSTVNADGKRTGKIASTEARLNAKADATFIAMCREMVPALLAEREALREDLRLAIMSDSEEVKALSVMTSRYVEALTPSASTKAAYMGEFSMSFPEMDEDGNERMRKINIPWTTIKEIMAAISARARKALGE